MISTSLAYGAHAQSQPYRDLRVTLGQWAWKTSTDMVHGELTVIDSHLNTPATPEEAELFDEIITALQARGVRTMNNSHGRVSLQMDDVTNSELNLWYHIADDTGSVSLATYQAPWIEVPDRVTLAMGVLMTVMPLEVRDTAFRLDAILLPLFTRLAEARQKRAEAQRTMIQ